MKLKLIKEIHNYVGCPCVSTTLVPRYRRFFVLGNSNDVIMTSICLRYQASPAVAACSASIVDQQSLHDIVAIEHLKTIADLETFEDAHGPFHYTTNNKIMSNALIRV